MNISYEGDQSMTQLLTFPADEAALDSILSWTRERILSGPDPRNGAQSQAVLEAALGNLRLPRERHSKR